ncbi:secretory protein, putative [Babesia bigemina]|uniref:Secretory protein, putative n=1 Tax=Babesia bigemina TaxID=5866 RepID=A0A061D5U9_BABBI|nr:secretory protein, putative [Babesia bigemina]CDR95387.1 secretory protein, putative [Babesia bigemina]|eukprot:XP_012767573.1 secretory protein, putative [Babesia bigemina]
MAILRAREQIITRSIRREARVRLHGKRVHKRFRSWTQQRTRKFWMPIKVSLHAPTELMDGWLLSAAVQKAAVIRKHDVRLWHSFVKRVLDLSSHLTSQQIGFGKSRFLNKHFYDELMKQTEPVLSTLSSSSLMSIVWALNRLQIRETKFLTRRISELRVADLIKICNGLGRLDICNPVFKKVISENMVERLQTIYAQDFRNVINAVAMIYLYDERTQKYIMERFSKTFICARPQYLHHGITTAVAMRVLMPDVWSQLDRNTREFYTRLSTRKIHLPLNKPSAFHWDVSHALGRLGIAHRNSFYWGCYWIDIGEVEERKNCWFVDGPSCFYTGTTHYTNQVKLQHRVLENLGWSIRRIPWFKWIDLTSNDGKVSYVRNLRNSPAAGEVLTNDEWMDSAEIAIKLSKIKKHFSTL